MSRLLLATWEGGGVVPPELGLAKRLIARGHQVRVLADSSVEAEARAAGCAFTAWSSAPNRASLAPEHEIVRSWELSPVAQFKAFLDGVMCGPAARYAADTLAAIEADPVDAALVDMNLLGALLAVEALGLPRIALVPNIYMRPTLGIPPLGPGLVPATGPLGRVRDAILQRLSSGLWRGGLAPLNAVAAAHGLRPLSDLFEIYDRADAVLVLTAAAFDFPARVPLPANVRYVGPILDDPSWALDAPLGSSDQPLVVASLSSTFQGQAQALRNIALALADQPVRALITLGPALTAADVASPAANVECVAAVSHARVLPHASAVISHCGHGTAIKALTHGLPIVCMPMGRDQNDNAARIVARGAGLRLSPSASPKQIRRAVERVLGEPSFRTAAAALGQQILAEAAHDPAGVIEDLLASRANGSRTEAPRGTARVRGTAGSAR